MAIDVTVPRSRRAVLAAALGGLAATAAEALGRPKAALATDGQPVVQGQDNSGSASTIVRSSTTTAFQGLADAASGTAYGVRGRSNSGDGAGVVGQVVAATGTNYGVRGLTSSPNGAGVRGEGPNYGVRAYATATSFFGFGVDATTSTPEGAAVRGEATATSGFASGVFGRARTYGVYGVAEGAPSGAAVRAQAIGGSTSHGVNASSQSANGAGVLAINESSAPTARAIMGGTGNGTGVHAWVGSEPLASPKTGVHGECSLDGAAIGVLGRTTVGTGVHGRSSIGTGVHAEATTVSGTALKVTGKAVFSRSGKATVLPGATTVVVSNVTLTSASIVIATIQGSGASGLYVRNVSVSVANKSFTIRLSKAPAVNTRVGWFLVN